MRNPYEPVAVTAAVTGGDVLPSQSPAVPCGPEAIAAAAIAAAEAGATSVHLHARELDGKPTASADMFVDIVSAIRASSDVVINVTTGGSVDMTAAERLQGVVATRPDIATLNLGTMNFEGFPTKERWPDVKHQWERDVLANSGRVVFTNTLAMMRDFASTFRDLGVCPELEVYDMGHLNMARFLLDEGTLQGPLRIQFVLGTLGGAGGSIQDLFALEQAAHRILGADLSAISVAAVGYPGQLRMAAVAAAGGFDIRVGIEDNLRIRRRRQAVDSAELVAAAVAIAEQLERPIATPTELRAQLGPWYSTRSNR
ncbi:BKACE family enzyme [Mycolicibacterium mageritense]|uniref:3-keto-5-aminohexanoate cleavage enzyme n=1 Tax=Mycolicibacterium mageritense TaxID=53462 RepID=A0AAI8XPN5_MYCME|nr:3-keto-5-aminohexanoate cleavage protein [Mycolicibacterium mageritense]BDY32919.1 3-keto-5-aminohexanoate cleavage enzyme [Mycolicibacterium mageritense]